MKKLILMLSCILFSFSFTQAQGLLQGDPSSEVEQNVNQEVENLREELALTGKQEHLVQDKLTEFAMKRNDVLESDLEEDQKRTQLKALRINELRELRDILTQPQYRQLVQYEREKRKQNEEEMKNKS